MVGEEADTARSTIAWFRNKASRVSAHYLIDKDGTIYRCVPEELVAWHAGVSFWHGRAGVNARSIGIELVNRNDGVDPYPAEQWRSALWLGAALVRRYGIAPENVVAHYDVSPGRKNDPRGFDMQGYRIAICGSSAPPRDLHYVVPSVANVRSGPGTSYSVVRQLQRGEAVRVEVTVDNGEHVFGTSRWCKLRGGQWYVHSKLLRV
ncbi:MAG: hypothetical protein RLZZ387_4906 [Chloroflexota bacterium]